MAVSISDFATKVAQATPTSGAVFRTQLNADGSLEVLRAPSATSGVWSVYHNRVVYTAVNDTVTIGDGSDIATESSAAYVAGLN